MAELTPVKICNSALREVHAGSISDLTENDSCEHFYPLMRDEMLGRHDWSFATKRKQLAVTTDTVVGDDTLNVYEFPTEPYCLRVIEVLGTAAEWVIEGRQILSADTSPIKIRYVARVTEDVFPFAFASALAVRLAAEIAIDEGGNAQLMSLLIGRLEGPGGLLDQAIRADIREKQVGQATRGAKLWVNAR